MLMIIHLLSINGLKNFNRQNLWLCGSIKCFDYINKGQASLPTLLFTD
jgi:hypothetical protein